MIFFGEESEAKKQQSDINSLIDRWNWSALTDEKEFCFLWISVASAALCTPASQKNWINEQSWPLDMTLPYVNDQTKSKNTV